MLAERDTNDRYLAAYLSERIGDEMAGRISGVTRFGLFVKLDENGADGLVPIRSLGSEFFHYDAQAQTLMGSDTGLTLGLGQVVTVKLAEAAPVTGGVILELLEVDGAVMPRGPSRGSRAGRPGKPPRRKTGKAKAKAAKTKRKVARTRR